MTDQQPNSEARRRAVLQISLDTDPQGALLLNALGDDDWRVRKEAVRIALTMTDDTQVLEQIIGAMVQEQNVGLRNAAAETLSLAGPRVIGIILERLEHFDPGGRKIALDVLGASNDSRTVKALASGLKDPDKNVRACAAEWLGEHGGPVAITALLDCLGGDDKLLVLTALQSLNLIRTKIPWTKLKPLIGEKRLYGAELLFALGRSGNPEAAALIADNLVEDPSAIKAMELLHADSAQAAQAVHEVLGKIDHGVLDHLQELTMSTVQSERIAAASCLLWSRSPKYFPKIVDLAKYDFLYQLLLDELRKWGPKALDLLEQMSHEAQGRNLASVLGLLTRLLDDETGKKKVLLFSQHLKSTDLAVATAAAGAMSRFGDQSAAQKLFELMSSSDERVSRTVGYALTDIGRRCPDQVRVLIKDEELTGQKGIQLCKVLEVVGGPQDIGRLKNALSSNDSKLRHATLGALAAIATDEVVEIIAGSLDDKDNGVKMAAVAALARVGKPASQTIVDSLEKAHGPVKAALIRALGRVGHPEAAKILTELLSQSADVALAALAATRQLGIDPALIQDEIIHHPDDEVIKQALDVLGASVSLGRLKELLEHRSWDVRLACVKVLAAVDDSRSMDFLTQKYKTETDDLVRESIQRAIGIVEEDR